MQLSDFMYYDIPLAGQQVLMRDPDVTTRAVLASSPLTNISIVNILAQDTNPTVRRVAHLRTTNVEVLTKALDGLIRHGRRHENLIWTVNNHIGTYAARNPNAPTEMLVEALDNPDEDIALNAYVNPATPEADRRKLTPKRAAELIEVAMCLEQRNVRAGELVQTNLWMLDNAGDWNSAIKSAIAGMTSTSKETLAQLQPLGIWDSARRDRHPAGRGNDITTISLEKLIELGDWATDLEAMSRPEFTDEHARQILARKESGWQCRNYERVPTTHVIGQIIRRYGASIFFLSESSAREQRWSVSKLIAATWIAPVTEYPDRITPKLIPQDAQDAAKILSDNADYWEMFNELLPHWHGTMTEAAYAAQKL